MILKGQCHRSKQMPPLDTIRFPDFKNIEVDTNTIIPTVLVQNLWSKTDICKMVAMVMHSGTSHVQTA